MKLRRSLYQFDGRMTSAGAWMSEDGLWLFALGVGGWHICPLSYAGDDDSERDHLLQSLGLDVSFKTRREAVAALQLALPQQPLA